MLADRDNGGRQGNPIIVRGLNADPLGSGDGNNDGGGSQRNAQRLVVSEEEIIPAAVAGRTYGRSLGSSSGVDISV